MKVLNLTNKDTSEIKYGVSRFPDGQQQITIPYIGQKFCNSIVIKSRLGNFLDLELIICAVKALRNDPIDIDYIHLYVPYFLGGRSDRKFKDGSTNYLKDIICPIINSLDLESVTILDPHSNVLEACINNFKSIDNSELVKFAFGEIGNYDSMEIDDHKILVSPDSGAAHKIYNLVKKIDCTSDIITCSKERAADGSLSKCVVPLGAINNKDVREKDYIIIDDICDGGATFINIAKEIDRQYIDMDYEKPKKYLIVTHGVFSRGFGELCIYFNGIFCTNSYSDLKFHPTISDVIGPSKKLVKQLNIF